MNALGVQVNPAGASVHGFDGGVSCDVLKDHGS